MAGFGSLQYEEHIANWLKEVAEDNEPSDVSDGEEDENEAPPATSLSESSSDVASDAEDVFCFADAQPESLPAAYKHLFLYRWQLATADLCENHLRRDLTLPMDPRENRSDSVWDNVDEAVVLPDWHCGFRGCKKNGANSPDRAVRNHECGLWEHVWRAHRQVLQNIMVKYALEEEFCTEEETAFTLLNQATSRSTKSRPPLSLSPSTLLRAGKF